MLGLLGSLVSLLVVVLIASYLFNLATDSTSRPVTSLWHGGFIEADGVLTAYREWGKSGSPIVLVGGFLEPSFVWSRVGPLLAKDGHRVYALDLDGFGFSARRAPYTLAAWTAQVQAFMRALHLKDPLVAGHSLGAAVAVELAIEGSASGAVLVDGDALRTGGPPRILADLLSHLPLVTSALRLSTDWDWPVEEILERVYAPNPVKLDHSLVAEWTEQFRANDAEAAITAIIGNGVQGFSRAALQHAHIHATVIWGTRDGIDPLSAGRQTAHDLHARLMLIPDTGHLAVLTDPVAVANAILSS